MAQRKHAEDEDFRESIFSSPPRQSFQSPVFVEPAADVRRHSSNISRLATSNFYLSSSAAESFVSEDPDSSYTLTPPLPRHDHSPDHSMSQENHQRAPIDDEERRQPRHIPTENPLPTLRGLTIRGSDQRNTDHQDTLIPRSTNASVRQHSTAMLPIRKDGVLVIGYSHTDSRRKHIATWYFHGLTLAQAEELLAARGLQHMLRTCPPGRTGGEPSRGAPNFSTPSTTNGFSAAQNRGSNGFFTGDGSNVRVDIAGRQPILEPGLYYACPFSKHDPVRYMEHVKKYHAPPSACPSCKAEWNVAGSEEWSKEDALEAFYEHESDCRKRSTAGVLAYPEWLDKEQAQRVDNRDFRGNRSTEQIWKQFYEEDLFPSLAGTVAPSPYYDYYIPRHMIQTPSNQSFDLIQINTPVYPNVPFQNYNYVPYESPSATTNDSFLEHSPRRAGNASRRGPNGTTHTPNGLGQPPGFDGQHRQHKYRDSGYAVPELDGFEYRRPHDSRNAHISQTNDAQSHTFGFQGNGHMDLDVEATFYHAMDGPAGFVNFIQQELQPEHLQMNQDTNNTTESGAQAESDHQCFGPNCMYCWSLREAMV